MSSRYWLALAEAHYQRVRATRRKEIKYPSVEPGAPLHPATVEHLAVCERCSHYADFDDARGLR